MSSINYYFFKNLNLKDSVQIITDTVASLISVRERIPILKECFGPKGVLYFSPTQNGRINRVLFSAFIKGKIKNSLNKINLLL